MATVVANRIASAQQPPLQPTQANPAKGVAKDVVDTALADPNLTTWARAVKQSGMDSTLHLTPGKFTLFAPTDAAFAKLPPATLKKLFDNSIEGQEAMTELVMRHAVVGSALHAADLKTVKTGSLKSILGPPIAVHLPKAQKSVDSASAKSVTRGITVNNAHIVQADILTSNGIIHTVDTVFPK